MTARPARTEASAVPAVDVFTLRCWARATLFEAGELTLIEAVDKLQADAVRDGLVAELGIDGVQAILNSAFSGADA
jgi:hypothetical protein